MTTRDIKRTPLEFAISCKSDLIAHLALLGSFLFVTVLVVGLV